MPAASAICILLTIALAASLATRIGMPAAVCADHDQRQRHTRECAQCHPQVHTSQADPDAGRMTCNGRW